MRCARPHATAASAPVQLAPTATSPRSSWPRAGRRRDWCPVDVATARTAWISGTWRDGASPMAGVGRSPMASGRKRGDGASQAHRRTAVPRGGGPLPNWPRATRIPVVTHARCAFITSMMMRTVPMAIAALVLLVRVSSSEPSACEYDDGPQKCKTRCDEGSPTSCASLGLMYLRGQFVKSDPAGAPSRPGTWGGFGTLGEPFSAHRY